MPLTAGVAGAELLPFWAAIAGIVALAKDFTIVVERDTDAMVKSPEEMSYCMRAYLSRDSPIHQIAVSVRVGHV